jgi:hypothetical protein
MVARLARIIKLCPEDRPVSRLYLVDNRDLEFCLEHCHTPDGRNVLPGILAAKDEPFTPMGTAHECRPVFSVSFLVTLGKPRSDHYSLTGCVRCPMETKHLLEHYGSLLAKHHWFDWLICGCIESLVAPIINTLSN